MEFVGFGLMTLLVGFSVGIFSTYYAITSNDEEQVVDDGGIKIHDWRTNL